MRYVKPHPLPLSASSATGYTQVIELPHPNPPLVKGRERDSLVSPLSKGGLRGVIRLVYTRVLPIPERLDQGGLRGVIRLAYTP